MFRDNDPRILQLSQILTQYRAICASDPLRFKEIFPSLEVWRFFVDGYRQGEGWVPFEDQEKNYLLALYRAFEELFEPSNIDVNFIKKLHKIALTDVKGTVYDELPSSIGEFRSSGQPMGYFPLVWGNASEMGLFEMLNEILKLKSNPFLKIAVLLPSKNDGLLPLFLEPDSYAELVSMENISEDAGNGCMWEILEALEKFTSIIIDDFDVLDDSLKKDFIDFLHIVSKQDLKNISQYIMQRLEKNSMHKSDLNLHFRMYSCQNQEDVNELLTKAIEKFSDEYNANVKIDQAPLSKLKVIIHFIQQCEQLHPFADGNCRVFCMLLLNHLLLHNGFPPVILHNPNFFDAYSKDELLDQVLLGMEQTFYLLEHRELYGVASSQILQDLDSNSQEYFLNLLNREHQLSNKIK